MRDVAGAGGGGAELLPPSALIVLCGTAAKRDAFEGLQAAWAANRAEFAKTALTLGAAKQSRRRCYILM